MQPSTEPDDRRRALDAVRGARNPHQVLSVLAELRAARDPTLVADLAGDAGKTTNPDLARLRTNQAVELADFFASVEQASQVTNLEQFLELVGVQRLAFSGLFWEIIRLLADDAADMGDMSRATALRAGFAINEAVTATLVRLNEFLAVRDDRKELDPAFCEPAFLDWLRLYHRAFVENEPDAAASIAAIREYLITRIRVAGAIRDLKADADGNVRIPAEGFIDVWHLIQFHMNEPFARLANELSDIAVTIEACLAKAIALADVETPNEYIFWGAYFLESAFRNGPPERTAEALESYRRLVDTSGTGSLEKATVSLRYCMALNIHWRRAHRPREALLEGLSLLDDALRVVPVERQRFVRDIHFTRARVAENLATWEPRYLEEALNSLQSGLKIGGVDHDRSARGRALGDLGNVLGKLAAKRGGVDWTDVDAAFEDALSHLPDKTDWGRAVVLSNFAVSLMERPSGDRGANVERSLVLVNEALTIAGDIEATGSWMREAHAGMHLTRGNALRERAYGSREDRLREARETFFRGQHFAPEGSHVIGLLRLDQALVATELALTHPDGPFADEAARCFEEARELVAQDPVLAAVAAFAEYTTQENEPGALNLARSAVARLAELGAARELSWRALWLARRVSRLGENGRDEAAKLLRTSLAQYRTLGDAEGVVEALRATAALELTELGTPSGEQLARCERLLEEARHHAEALWRSQPTIEWRLSRAYITVVCAELAWVKAAQGAPLDDVIATSCLAKDREFLEHTKLLAAPVINEAAHEAIALARGLEMERWKAQNDAAPTESVFEKQRDTQHSIAEARLTEALLVGRYEDINPEGVRARLAAFFAAHPNALVLDFTPSRWGTVVLILDAGTSAVCNAPLTDRALDEFIARPNGWAAAYARWRNAAEIEKPDAWNAWQGRRTSCSACFSMS